MIVQTGDGLRSGGRIAQHAALAVQQRQALFRHIKNGRQLRKPGCMVAEPVQYGPGQHGFTHKAFTRRFKLGFFKPGLAVEHGHGYGNQGHGQHAVKNSGSE